MCYSRSFLTLLLFLFWSLREGRLDGAVVDDGLLLGVASQESAVTYDNDDAVCTVLRFSSNERIVQ